MEVNSASIKIDNQLSWDIDTIMSANIEKASPFMKLFWNEQIKNFDQKSRRYHPMIIRFCLAIASKSGSAYDELRDSGVICLPSRRTLRDYRNAIRPQTGFSIQIIEELKKMTSNLEGHQKFVCLSFDEIKIESGLVFNKYTGQIIGFTDLGDTDINEKEKSLATHALLFFIRGISCDLKFP